MFQNPSPDEIAERLRMIQRIAVVGLSPNPARPSHGVSQAMQGFGYTVVPVRPAVTSVLGETAYPTLDAVPGQIDLVNVFRNARELSGIVDSCIRLGLPAIWAQDGVIDENAAERARAAGIWVVMDRCIYRDYVRYCRTE